MNLLRCVTCESFDKETCTCLKDGHIIKDKFAEKCGRFKRTKKAVCTTGYIPRKPNHVCPVCNKPFYRIYDWSVYCSRECAGIASRKRTAKYVMVTCPVCGKEFEKREHLYKKFCSKACAYSTFDSRHIVVTCIATGEKVEYKSIYKVSKDFGVAWTTVYKWLESKEPKNGYIFEEKGGAPDAE